MKDKELYQRLLGLTVPWSVSVVKIDLAPHEILLSASNT